jgi:hypothetical protein
MCLLHSDIKCTAAIDTVNQRQGYYTACKQMFEKINFNLNGTYRLFYVMRPYFQLRAAPLERDYEVQFADDSQNQI